MGSGYASYYISKLNRIKIRNTAPNKKSMHTEKVQIVKKRYLYKQLILSGKIKLPPKAALAFVGPDCIYHLYRHLETPFNLNRGTRKHHNNK